MDKFSDVPHLKLACIIGVTTIAIILFVAAASSAAISRVKKLEKDMAENQTEEITSMTSTTVEPDIYGMMDDYIDAYEIRTEQSIAEKIKSSMTGVSAEEVKSLISDSLKNYLTSQSVAELFNNYFSSYNTNIDKKIEEINKTIIKNTDLTTEKLNDIYTKISSNKDDISSLRDSLSTLKSYTESNITDLSEKYDTLKAALNALSSGTIEEINNQILKLSSNFNEFLKKYEAFVNDYNVTIQNFDERITNVEGKSQIVISPTAPAEQDVLWIVPCG